jgi:hypothetical protein
VSYLGACENQDRDGNSSGGVSSKEVQKKAAAAVKALTDFAKQKNDEFSKQVETQLSELDRKIRELNGKVAEMGQDASQELKDMVEQMSRQSEAAREKLAELGSTTGESVEAIKESIEEQVDNLEETYQKADSSAQ